MTDVIRTYVNNEKLVQAKRRHIADCAAKLFAKQGFDATSLREISNACSMPLGSIYNYISTKEDILHFICESASDNWKQILQEIVTNYKDGSVTDLLRFCFERWLQYADEMQDENMFFDREIRHFSSEDRRTLLQSQAAIIFFFEGLLQRGIDSGEFKIDSPVCVAHNILMAGINWGQRRWFLRPRFKLDEYAKIQGDMIINSIRADRKEIM
jgi:AcrR family transcriptional regulator